MDKKKLKLFAVLSALCLFCVLSEAYLRGYIQPGVKQASKNKTVVDNSQNKGTEDNNNKESNSNGSNSNTGSCKIIIGSCHNIFPFCYVPSAFRTA